MLTIARFSLYTDCAEQKLLAVLWESVLASGSFFCQAALSDLLRLGCERSACIIASDHFANVGKMVTRTILPPQHPHQSPIVRLWKGVGHHVSLRERENALHSLFFFVRVGVVASLAFVKNAVGGFFIWSGMHCGCWVFLLLCDWVGA